jgi:hypothetical protein
MLAAASAVAVASIGDDPYKNLEIQGPPHGGGSCICPMNYDPVVCRGSDGSLHAFSNACVAACNGYTSCVQFAVHP